VSSLRSRRRAKATTPRPSDEIALELDDIDLARGTIRVCKAHVMMRDKDWTKTGKDRTVELCPRAIEVLKRQLALRARYQPERKELYNARHSFVSWSLMIGKNVFWLAKQLGHSVQTMLSPGPRAGGRK
jgi:integrase